MGSGVNLDKNCPTLLKESYFLRIFMTEDRFPCSAGLCHFRGIQNSDLFFKFLRVQSFLLLNSFPISILKFKFSMIKKPTIRVSDYYNKTVCNKISPRTLLPGYYNAYYTFSLQSIHWQRSRIINLALRQRHFIDWSKKDLLYQGIAISQCLLFTQGNK